MFHCIHMQSMSTLWNISNKWHEICLSQDIYNWMPFGTHNSPVEPNAGNVVDGVASQLFVCAVAWSDDHSDCKLEQMAVCKRYVLDTAGANVVLLELKDGSLWISQFNLQRLFCHRSMRFLQIEMWGAG